ncbi:Uncharacterised protein [Salmonella enterica subsp. diarizonae]|uniref:Uncharacterized protein n=1 Tax=Salmonella diarizonae TaxID=59204 RepID=A0A379TWQ2_SALDZ|nr:Uncharacterised protein [Salmonella enterica subsp. diarizonae]
MASMTGPPRRYRNSPPASAGEIFNTDVAEQVVDVGVAQGDLSVAAARGVVDRREVVSFRQALNIAQTGVTAYRARALAHSFMPL